MWWLIPNANLGWNDLFYRCAVVHQMCNGDTIAHKEIYGTSRKENLLAAEGKRLCSTTITLNWKKIITTCKRKEKRIRLNVDGEWLLFYWLYSWLYHGAYSSDVQCTKSQKSKGKNGRVGDWGVGIWFPSIHDSQVPSHLHQYRGIMTTVPHGKWLWRAPFSQKRKNSQLSLQASLWKDGGQHSDRNQNVSL